MKKRTSRIYVGRLRDNRPTTPDLRSWVIFRSDEPTPEKSPLVAYCVGPFRTRHGAAIFVEWSCAPTAVTVAMCEAEAKKRETRRAIEAILSGGLADENITMEMTA